MENKLKENVKAARWLVYVFGGAILCLIILTSIVAALGGLKGVLTPCLILVFITAILILIGDLWYRWRGRVEWTLIRGGLQCKRPARASKTILWGQIEEMFKTGEVVVIRWRKPKGAGGYYKEYVDRLYVRGRVARNLISTWKARTSARTPPDQLRPTMFGHYLSERQALLARIGTLALISAGLLLTYWIGESIRKDSRARFWPSVQGKIILSSYTEEYHRRSAMAVVSLRYEYRVADRTYRNGRVSLKSYDYRNYLQTAQPFIRGHIKGDVVPVYYNPENPEESVLLRGPGWIELTVPLLGGPLVMGVGILVWPKRRVWRRCAR